MICIFNGTVILRSVVIMINYVLMPRQGSHPGFMNGFIDRLKATGSSLTTSLKLHI